MLLANRLSLINNAALRSQSSLERRVGRLQAVWGGWLFLTPARRIGASAAPCAD